MKLFIPALALAMTAFGQGPADRPALTYDDLKTYLTLTDAQLTTLKAAHTTAMENAKTYFDQIREKQQSLRSLTDAAAIAKIMAEINELQAKVKAIMDAARTAAVGTLNSAQQAKLKTLQDAVALNDEIRQAGSLGLLSPPEGSTAGPGGPGPRGFGGARR